MKWVILRTAAVMPLLFASLSPEPDGAANIATTNLAQRGKDLRAALNQAYAHRGPNFGGFPHGTDVTGVVLPYIPVGTSFEDAETILRDAGFTVGPRPDPAARPIHQSKDSYAVLARINPFARVFVGKVSIYVSLLPPSPSDYSAVSQVSATFLVSMP